MIYKITWAKIIKEGKTNGRKWHITEMELEDPEGKVIEKVSTFDSVMSGGTIEGTIEQGKYGMNFKKLEAPDFVKQNRGGAYKEKVIGEAMHRKEESIGKFQDNKDWSIKTSSTINKAVDLAVAEYRDETSGRSDLPSLVLKWRKWLWNNWDVDLSDTDAITGKLN